MKAPPGRHSGRKCGSCSLCCRVLEITGINPFPSGGMRAQTNSNHLAARYDTPSMMNGIDRSHVKSSSESPGGPSAGRVWR